MIACTFINSPREEIKSYKPLPLPISGEPLIDEQPPLFPTYPSTASIDEAPKAIPKEDRKTFAKSIDSIVGIFQKPLIVADSQWADSIPGWLRQRVTIERLVQAYKGEQGLSTDAEACCYLSTASLCAPLDHEHTNIYLHIATRLVKQEGREVPLDLEVPTLSNYEQHCLNQLKRKIWDSSEKGYREKKKTRMRDQESSNSIPSLQL